MQLSLLENLFRRHLLQRPQSLGVVWSDSIESNYRFGSNVATQ